MLTVARRWMTNVHTHAHTHAYIHTCMHAHTHIHKHACMHTHTHMYTILLINTNTLNSCTIIISCSCEHNLSSSPRPSDGRHLECVGCTGDQCRDFNAVSAGIGLPTIFKPDKDIFRASPFDFTRICDLISTM